MHATGGTIRLALLFGSRKMKKIALATALSVAATAGFAGGYSEPVMEPEIIVQDTSSSAGGVIVPILALILFAAVIAD